MPSKSSENRAVVSQAAWVLQSMKAASLHLSPRCPFICRLPYSASTHSALSCCSLAVLCGASLRLLGLAGISTYPFFTTFTDLVFAASELAYQVAFPTPPPSVRVLSTLYSFIVRNTRGGVSTEDHFKKFDCRWADWLRQPGNLTA